MKGLLVNLVCLVLMGCNDKKDTSSHQSEINATDSENIFVYIERGNTQCKNDGIQNDESTQVLVQKGIDVLSTTCGFTGYILPSVCDGPSADMIVHEIREVNESDAKNIGYLNIEMLSKENSGGLGYQLYDCTGTMFEPL